MFPLKEIEKARKKLRQWTMRTTGQMRPRTFFANPDLCISICPYFMRPSRRYLIKKGAKKGHLVLTFGWLWATIRW